MGRTKRYGKPSEESLTGSGTAERENVLNHTDLHFPVPVKVGFEVAHALELLELAGTIKRRISAID